MKTPNRNIGHMIIESSWISNSNSWAFLSTSVVNEKRIKGNTMKPMKNGRKRWFLVPIIEGSEDGNSLSLRFSSPTNLVMLPFKMKWVYCIILSPTGKYPLVRLQAAGIELESWLDRYFQRVYPKPLCINLTIQRSFSGSKQTLPLLLAIKWKGFYLIVNCILSINRVNLEQLC